MAPATAERSKQTDVGSAEPISEIPAVPEAHEQPGSPMVVIGDGTDPLDVSFAATGVVPPVYYNPFSMDGRFYIHARDQHGRSQLLWIGIIKDGTYRFDTPRQEQWVRDNISTNWLNGNPPDRWMGENLEEEDRFRCADCPFTCRNTKVAIDHRRHFLHRERV